MSIAPLRVLLLRLTIMVLFAVVVYKSVQAGMEVRRWEWDWTQPIRFSDIERGYRYGHRAVECGYADLYDIVITEHMRPGEFNYNELDYAPLRLWAMEMWAKQTLQKYPKATIWQSKYEFTEPVLKFNTSMELLGAVGMFLLVRLWIVRRARPAPSRRPLGQWFWEEILGRRRLSTQHSVLSTGCVHLWSMPELNGLSPGGGAALLAWLRAVLAPFRGWGWGLFAALLLWFDPAMLLSAHGWPGWDSWIIPFYVWAIFLVSLDCWFCAGVALALGALFKGQQLLVAPLLVLCPLFMGRPGAAVRFAVGMAVGVAAVVSIWMLRVPLDAALLDRLYQRAIVDLRISSNPGGYMDPIIDWRKARNPNAPVVNMAAVRWVISVPILIGAAAGARFLRRMPWGWMRIAAPAGALVAIAGLLAWRMRVAGAAYSGMGMWGIILPVLGVGLAFVLPLRRQGYLLAAATAIALFLCIPFFNASTGWYTIGWGYGTHHWNWMIMGQTSNIPGLLTERFGFRNQIDLRWIVTTLQPQALWLWPSKVTPIDLRTFLGAIYGLTLLLCCIGAARHLRRHDSRFLVAAVAPWLLLFTILGQIHERYLLWAAGLSVVLVAVDFGFVFLHLFLTGAAWIMTMHPMLRSVEERSMYMGTRPLPVQFRRLYAWIQATHPDLAWGIALAALLLLYVAMMRPRKAGATVKPAAEPEPAAAEAAEAAAGFTEAAASS